MSSPVKPQPFCVVILFSIHFVLKAEKLFKKNNITHDVIPVPREISSDCGMAVEFPCREKERVADLLAAAGLRIAGVYVRDANVFRSISVDNTPAVTVSEAVREQEP